MSNEVRAIVLCAGAGVRVAEITGGKPKSFLQIGEQTLIERQLALLRAAGIEDITLVVGFEAKLFRDSFPGCRFVENPDYRSTNTAFSLALALRAKEERSILVLNADVYFDENVLPGILNAEGESVAALDCKRNGEEEIKVLHDGSRITGLGKYVNEDIAIGEAFGVYKLSPRFARYLRREILLQNNPKAFYERGIDQLLRGGHVMKTYDIEGSFCMEIDTAEDYYELIKNLGV
jgi:choline kinase